MPMNRGLLRATIHQNDFGLGEMRKAGRYRLAATFLIICPSSFSFTAGSPSCTRKSMLLSWVDELGLVDRTDILCNIKHQRCSHDILRNRRWRANCHATNLEKTTEQTRCVLADAGVNLLEQHMPLPD